MAPTTIQLEVTSDHAVPVEPSLGGTVTVLNVSGDTLYYADNKQVSATNNQGSLAGGQSVNLPAPQWVISASLSTVTVTVLDPVALPPGGSGVSLTPTVLQSGTATVATNQYVPFDLSAVNGVLPLPNAPADKSQVGYKVEAFTTGKTLTVTTQGADAFDTGATSVTPTLVLGSAKFWQYNATAKTWTPLYGDTPISQLDVRYPSSAATGPGGVAGANTGASPTVPAPTNFSLYFGVANVNTTLAVSAPTQAGQGMTIIVDEPGGGGSTIALTGTINYPNGNMVWQTGASARNAIDLFSVDGVHWDAYPLTGPALLLASNNLSELTAAATARFNLGVASVACKAAGTTNVASLSGTTTIDSVALGAGDVVLLTGQTTGSQNGPWQVNAGAWTRPLDYPASGTGFFTKLVDVSGGSANSGVWLLSGTATVTVGTTATSWTKISGGGGSTVYLGFFSDGSDGAATLDGVATVTWASLAGSTYTMTTDCNLTSLTVNNGVTLITTGCRIRCQGTVTNNGTISANGANANVTTAGTNAAGVTIGTGSSGHATQTGVGVTGTAGVTGGQGAAGGTGGAGAGGGSSTQAVPTTALKQVFMQPAAAATAVFFYTTSNRNLTGASGGASGAGDNTNSGGAGGAGGSPIVIFAHAFVNAGNVNSTGGNGGTPTTGNCGGGGGGGGGFILVYTLSAATMGTTSVVGGSAGSGVGTGGAGSTGGAGLALNIVLA